MMVDFPELIARFIKLNRDLAAGYVKLAEYLETYTTLDLLSDREFQPIVLALSVIGIDLFFVLGVVIAMKLHLEKAHFDSLSAHLAPGGARIIIRTLTYPAYAKEIQDYADWAAARSYELFNHSLLHRKSSEIALPWN